MTLLLVGWWVGRSVGGLVGWSVIFPRRTGSYITMLLSEHLLNPTSLKILNIDEYFDFDKTNGVLILCRKTNSIINLIYANRGNIFCAVCAKSN